MSTTNETPKLITVSMEQLKDMIDAAVKEAQADTSVEVAGIDYEKMGAAIGNAITKSGRPKVTIGQYVARLREGREKLRCKVFQNGILVQETFTSPTNAEIKYINQITHSGRYINRLVEVQVGLDGSEDVIYLSYNNSTPDRQYELKGNARDFEDMLRQIVEAQKAENAEFEGAQPATAVNRSFGNRKSTREAEARAALR